MDHGDACADDRGTFVTGAGTDALPTAVGQAPCAAHYWTWSALGARRAGIETRGLVPVLSKGRPTIRRVPHEHLGPPLIAGHPAPGICGLALFYGTLPRADLRTSDHLSALRH